MSGQANFADSLSYNNIAPMRWAVSVMHEVVEDTEVDEWALTGRFAANYHAVQDLGPRYPGNLVSVPFNDADVAFRSLASLNPRRTRQRTLVNHLHLPTPHGQYVHLVDREQPELGLDGFTLWHPDEVLRYVPFDRHKDLEVPILGLEALLVASVGFLQRRVSGQAGGGQPGKYMQQIELLTHLIDGRGTRKKAEELWRARYGEDAGSAFAAAEELQKQIFLRGYERTPVWRKQVRALLGRCSRCHRTDPEWPIVSDRRIALMRASQAMRPKR